ncbi:MAG: rod shape-determining protein [Clostridiales bacterium]|nr:rod shape-determining protein [Clostridiales bacterium]
MKKNIGGVYKRETIDSMSIKGRSLITGLPQTTEINSDCFENIIIVFNNSNYFNFVMNLLKMFHSTFLFDNYNILENDLNSIYGREK